MILAEGDEVRAADVPEGIGETAARPAKSAPARGEEGDSLAVPFTSDFREDRREFERRYITRCLEDAGGNVTRAAGVLGMHRQSLQHKLRELGLGRRYVAVDTDEPPEKPDN